MPIHDWTRVEAGTFHDFHGAWITHLKESLNDGLLPSEFYAMSEQHAGEYIADVLSLSRRRSSELGGQIPPGGIAVAESPPQVSLTMTGRQSLVTRRRTIAIRHRSGHQVVALIEIVSPGNKDHPGRLATFVEKVVEMLRHGVHVLVVDLHPPGPFDPQGIHAAIWRELTTASERGTDASQFVLPATEPLTLAAYVAHDPVQAYVEPVAVGSCLPDMPLFLDLGWYINVPLENTYNASYRGVPEVWREVIEGEK